MKKLLLLFAVMLSTVGAWAQVYQKVPHTKWTVTALNEATVQGNEGGLAFLKDENPSTFYHSDYSNSYSDGTSGKKKGQDGLQCFMVDMAEVCSFDRITYAGRSNGSNNWATKVRVYAFEELPSGWPMAGDTHKALSALTYTEKEALLKKENNTVLGTPLFDNNDAAWASDQNIKTIDFTEAKSGRYILFVADATSSSNGYLTCSDFHVWQKLDGIVADKPYFLKINGLDNYYLDTRVGEASDYGNTICKTQTPVATYFTLNDGYWHISSLPANERNFIGITNWDAIPGKDKPSNWTLHEVEEGLWSLAQSTYYGGGEAPKHYLGANDGNISGNSKFYTDKPIGQAVKFELVELSEEQATAEATRVAEDNLRYAKEFATSWLSRVGAGYPALDSEARTTLQNAMNAEDATRESVEAALAEYQAYQTVVMPEVGKVYRLVSGFTAFPSKKALYSDNNELKWQDKNDAAMNQLWTVLSCASGNIVLMNVNDVLYPQITNFATNVTMFSSKNECSISFCGKGQFQVFANKLQRMFANGHADGNGASGNITNYNAGGVDSYSSWYFEEVAITKDILSKQIESLNTAYIGSLLVKQESVADLAAAVDAAQGVCDAEGDYANAFAALVASVNNATIEYIDLGYFRMISKEGGKYAYNDNTSLKATTEKNSPKAIFKLTKANNGTFYVQNGNGYYAQGVSQSTIVNTAASVHEYVITRLTSGHYVLRPKNSTAVRGFWHQDGSSNVVGWSTDGGNTQWTFEALSEEELAKIYTVNMSDVGADAYVTYNGTYEGGDKDVKADGGFYVLDSAPAVEDFTVNGVTDGLDSKVFVSGRDITVVEGYDSEDIYIIRSKKSFSYARYHSGCAMSAEDDTNMLTWENNNLHWESLFYIEEGTGDYTGYYTIRPVSAPNLYVYNLESVDRNSAVATKERPTEGDLTANYYWKISTFGTEYANITPYGADDCGWNKRGSYDGKNHIGYWKGHNNDDDNKWIVRKVEEELIPYTTDDSALGLVTYESAQPMLPYIKLVTSENLSKVKGTKFDVVLPKQGEFYRLKNQVSNRYMTAESNAVKVYDECNDQSTIFYVDADNTLLSYAFGRYLDCGNKVLATVGTKYNGTFAKKCAVSYLPNVLAYYNNGYWTYGNKGNGVSIDRGSGNQPNDEGYNWVFEPVTTLPIAISAAGYATFYCPVAVTLPGGLEAYYVGETTNNSAKMTLIEGVIPANTGVILKGNEGTYDLTITTETSVASVETNLLTGTVASAYVGEDSYVLSKQTEGVGFYKAMKNFVNNEGAWTKADDGTHFLNNGFKAYLPKPEGTPDAARFFVFDFGGTETAIEGIEAESTANAVVYDLAGRRVQNAQKGVFIVNGKVVIK